jgi:hypothetical protein
MQNMRFKHYFACLTVSAMHLSAGSNRLFPLAPKRTNWQTARHRASHVQILYRCPLLLVSEHWDVKWHPAALAKTRRRPTSLLNSRKSARTNCRNPPLILMRSRPSRAAFAVPLLTASQRADNSFFFRHSGASTLCHSPRIPFVDRRENMSIHSRPCPRCGKQVAPSLIKEFRDDPQHDHVTSTTVLYKCACGNSFLRSFAPRSQADAASCPVGGSI